MVTGLRQQHFEVEVWIAGGGKKQAADDYLAAYPEIRGSVIRPRNLFASQKWRAIKKVLFDTKPDVVIPVMLADALYQAANLKREMDFRILYPVHEHGNGAMADVANYGSAMDAILCADRLTLDSISSVVPETRVLHIPCGVSWSKSPDAVKSLTDRVPVVGFCGRLEQGAKRATDLIRFYRELIHARRHFKLLIAGEGALRSQLESKISSSRSIDVSFLGGLSRDQLDQKFYPKIDYLLITSDSETGPLVAFEAMARKRLVITSNFLGRAYNGELIDRENCLVFPVGDMQKACSCILELEKDPLLRVFMQENGHAHFLATRTQKAMLDTWLYEIKRVMKCSPRLPRCKLRPPSCSHGKLASLGFSQAAGDNIRCLLGRNPKYLYASEEWPYYSQIADE